MSSPSHHIRNPKMIGQIVAALIFVCLCTLLGRSLAQQYGSHFFPPQSLEEDAWKQGSSLLYGSRHRASHGNGIYIVDHQLTLEPFSQLAFKNPAQLKELDITLSPESSALEVSIRIRKQLVTFFLAPTRFWDPYKIEHKTSGNGSFRILCTDRTISLIYDEQIYSFQVKDFVDPIPLAEQEKNVVFHLSNESESSFITQLRFKDNTDSWKIDHDYTQWDNAQSGQWYGGFIGLCIGLIYLFLFMSTNPLFINIFIAVIFVVPSLWISAVPFSLWLQWIEKLYLQNHVWDLARWSLFASLLPFIGLLLGLVGIGLPNTHTSGEDTHPSFLTYLWFALALLVFGLHTDELNIYSLLFFVPFVFLPFALVWKGIPKGSWLIRDLPALLILIALGWNQGILFALLYRICVGISSTRAFLAHAKIASMYLLILFFCTPLCAEILIRSTYLNEAWNFQTLSMEYRAEKHSSFLHSIWEDECGDKRQSPTRIIFSGGSSTGKNDYGFAPEKMYPAHTHQNLCSSMDERLHIESANFARGAFDTHILARTLDPLWNISQPDILVLYFGVNDLLTREHWLTKKQREETMIQWRNNIQGLQRYTVQSRLLFGSTLLFRSLYRSDQFVPNVPLPEARENLERLVAFGQKKQTQILLIAEYTRPNLGNNTDDSRQLRYFAQLLEELAQQNPHIHYYPIGKDLSQYSSAEILMDTNHFSLYGHKKMAKHLAPVLQKLLSSE